MKEHPILFTAEMVKAILQGHKTQTRRVIKPQPLPWATQFKVCPSAEVPNTGNPGDWLQANDNYYSVRGLGKCPYGVPGDQLWVRETWATSPYYGGKPRDIIPNDPENRIVYREDIPTNDSRQSHYVWRPSIFMPRWASRITLEVTSIRVERVQEISNTDALAEGIERGKAPFEMSKYLYRNLWDSINSKKYPWSSTPWVWVIEFRRIS